MSGDSPTARVAALDAVVQLTRDIGALVQRDSTDARVAPARQFQRKAQFLVNFIEAENSMGFHAPQEAARVLAHALDLRSSGAARPRRPGERAGTADALSGAASGQPSAT